MRLFPAVPSVRPATALRPRVRTGWLASLIGLLLVLTSPAAENAVTSISRVDFQGWKNALRLSNSQVEAVVVPQVGRVMSFRFGDGENVFWTDRSLDGKQGDATGAAWINFGGDKTWPAPEADWRIHTKRTRWMPPPAFDALPVTARIDGAAVILTSPIDPFYGLRTIRRVSLQPEAAVMQIETTYERVSGEPARIGIWVITQFVDPVAVYLPIPTQSAFTGGYYVFGDKPWPQISTRGPLLRVTRDPTTSHKLGSDADRMLWVGETTLCLVASPRVPGAEYPDRGASAEIYTNPDPKTYVELETLGPLATMKAGDRVQQTNTYTLLRRTGNDPDAEARRILEP